VTDLHEAVEHRLRAVGQRYTAQRRTIVDVLRRKGNPVSIAELADPRDGLPQSSVYRNLAVLEQAGAVHRVVTDEFARYELAEALTEHHHHLVCRSCGTVEDVAVPPAFERQVRRAVNEIAERTGFAVQSHRLDLFGTCRNCR
jgi:Fur family transcriptional regulator, ferric uptake regulator